MSKWMYAICGGILFGMGYAIGTIGTPVMEKEIQYVDRVVEKQGETRIVYKDRVIEKTVERRPDGTVIEKETTRETDKQEETKTAENSRESSKTETPIVVQPRPKYSVAVRTIPSLDPDEYLSVKQYEATIGYRLLGGPLVGELGYAGRDRMVSVGVRLDF